MTLGGKHESPARITPASGEHEGDFYFTHVVQELLLGLRNVKNLANCGLKI